MSVFVQEGICDVKISAKNRTIAGKKVFKKAPTLEQMSGIKKRFGTHKGLLEYFLNVLDNLTEGTDPLNTGTRQLIKQLEEILPILREPANIDSDACKSLQTIRDYLVSITENLKGKKKIELAKKCVEALKPVDEYVEKLKEKEALKKTPPELPPRPQRLLDRNSSRISPSIEEMSPSSKRRRVDVSLDTSKIKGKDELPRPQSVSSVSQGLDDKQFQAKKVQLKKVEKTEAPSGEKPLTPLQQRLAKIRRANVGDDDDFNNQNDEEEVASPEPTRVVERRDVSPRSQSAPPASPSLLEQIRAGKQLKPVERRELKEPTSMMKNLSARISYTPDKDNNSPNDDDSDWDD